MKVTKAELKRIIKEELEEASFMGKVKKGLGMQNYADQDAAQLDDMINQLSKASGVLQDSMNQLVKMDPAKQATDSPGTSKEVAKRMQFVGATDVKDLVLKVSNGIHAIVDIVTTNLQDTE
tara:strand:+ start:732 stop:1094 length:363 start_codon:yes stop_codon:yes gene_type:complete